MNELLLEFVHFFKTHVPTLNFRNQLASIAPKACANIKIPQDCAECVLNPFLDALVADKRVWGITYVRHTICESKAEDKLLHVNFNEIQNTLNLDIPKTKEILKFEDLINAFQGKEYYPDTYKGDFTKECNKPNKLYWQSYIELSSELALFAIKRALVDETYNKTSVILPERFRGLDLNAIICGSGTHYWCYARREENQWYKLNDNQIDKMDLKDIIYEVQKNCVLVLYENNKKEESFIEAFGIKNNSNFCYQNAALQLIATSPNLKRIIFNNAKAKLSNPKIDDFNNQMKILNADLEAAIQAIQKAWENEVEDDDSLLNKLPLKDHRDNLKTIENLIAQHIAIHDKEIESMRTFVKKRHERE